MGRQRGVSPEGSWPCPLLGAYLATSASAERCGAM